MVDRGGAILDSRWQFGEVMKHLASPQEDLKAVAAPFRKVERRLALYE